MEAAYIIGIVDTDSRTYYPSGHQPTCIMVNRQPARWVRTAVGYKQSYLSVGGIDVEPTDWEWPIGETGGDHSERAALLRPIAYEVTPSEQGKNVATRNGRALSLNISNGGMLILMDRALAIESVLKVYVPTPIAIAGAPTLAEVRWTRRLPFGKPNNNEMHFVGLKFLF